MPKPTSHTNSFPSTKNTKFMNYAVCNPRDNLYYRTPPVQPSAPPTTLPAGVFSLSVRPEIRKNCTWEITLNFNESLMTFPIRRVDIRTNENDLKMREGEYYIMFKVRSKYSVPLFECGLDRVVELVDHERRVEINNACGAFRVKFTQRPRNVFRKHADVMILIGTLYCGSSKIAEGFEELIFRGGTGSIHSSKTKKEEEAKQQKLRNDSDSKYQESTITYAPILQGLNIEDDHHFNEFVHQHGHLDLDITKDVGYPNMFLQNQFTSSNNQPFSLNFYLWLLGSY
jgi:hypothetical protein